MIFSNVAYDGTDITVGSILKTINKWNTKNNNKKILNGEYNATYLSMNKQLQ